MDRWASRALAVALTLSFAAAVAGQGMTPPQTIGGLLSIGGMPLPTGTRASLNNAIRTFAPIVSSLRFLGDPPAVARGCAILATFHAALDDRAQAEQYFVEAKRIYERHGSNGSELAWVNNNRGILQRDAGQYADALRSFRLAVALLDGEPRIVALQNLASTYVLVGDAAHAEAAYLDALNLLRDLREEGSVADQVTRANLGILYGSTGEHAAARAMLEPLAREQALASSLRFAVLNNLGHALSGLGVFSKAESRLLEAMEVTRAGSAERALVLANLTSTYEALGNLDRAQKLGEEAWKLVEKREGRSSLAAAIAMGTLGGIARKRGDLAKAERLLSRSRNLLLRRSGGADSLAAVTHALALAAQQRNQPDRARVLRGEALEIAKKDLERILAFGSEVQRRAYQSESPAMKEAVLESLFVERALARKASAPADQEQLDRINALKAGIMEKLGRGDRNTRSLEAELTREQAGLSRRLAARPMPPQTREDLDTRQASSQ